MKTIIALVGILPQGSGERLTFGCKYLTSNGPGRSDPTPTVQVHARSDYTEPAFTVPLLE